MSKRSTTLSARDLERIFQSLPGRFLVLDPDLTIVAASDAYLEATMTTRPGIVGKGVFEVFPENPDAPVGSVQRVRDSFETVLRERKPHTMLVTKYDIPRPASLGGGFEERFWSPVNTPVLGDDGRVRYIIHRVEDVTELVRLQERGTLMEQELLLRTREVERTNRQLRTANEVLAAREQELAQSNRRKDEFLGMLAHELRNPLAPLRTAVDLLLAKPGDEQRATRCLAVMQRQIGNLARLLDDLLDVSRISRGKVELRKTRIEVGTAIERAVESRHRMMQEHELSLETPPEAAWIMGDPVRLEQILDNLLTNAVKYTRPGGRIWIAARPLEGDIEIRVRDTGIGMRPEETQRVFELFEQGPRELARSEGGLGVGLTVVKNLVELHGGSIRARSEGPGHGSEFIVRMPRAPADSVSPPATDPEPSDAGSDALRVLVVDDNEDAADMLAVLLQADGHSVATAYRAADALARVRHWRPDVAIVDIGLPDMDGYEIACRIRRDIEPAPHLIALTGYGRPEDRARSLEAGFDEHLVKPVPRAALRRVVDAARRRTAEPADGSDPQRPSSKSSA